MKRFIIPLLCLFMAKIIAYSQGKVATKAELPTALNGVFSTEQVSAVSEVYANNCAACHGRDLRGGEGGTALVGERFQSKWKNKTLRELYVYTKTTMPKTQPNSFDEKTYPALITFILNANGFPAGEKPLSFKNPSEKIMMGMAPPSRVSMGFKPALVNTKPKTIESEWKQHRGDFASTNYSPLDQINVSNLSQMKIAWRWKPDNFSKS